MSTVRLLDISGHFFPVWRIKEAKGEPIGAATAETVQVLRERASAGGADFVVACCDSGRTFRHDIGLEWRQVDQSYKGYKGNRAEKDPAMMAALDRVVDNIEQDGVPVLRAAGFEADDIIATLVLWAVAQGHDVEISTEDKDLFQLARDADETVSPRSPRVSVVRRDGSVVGPAEVRAKFGVAPHQLGEYLAIVGDTSDHVPGVKGLGAVQAQAIISKHGGYSKAVESARAEDLRMASLGPDDTYEPRFSQAQRTKLIEGERAFRFSLRLTTLRADVPLDFGVVTAPRVPKPKPETATFDPALVAAFETGETMSTVPDAEVSVPSSQVPANDPAAAALPSQAAAQATSAASAPTVIEVTPPAKSDTALAVVQTQAMAATNQVREFERQLEPVNFVQAMKLAECVAGSRKLKDMHDKNEVLLQMFLGRSIGLNLFQSLCQFYIVEGKGTMAAQLVVARIRQHPQCEYFRKKAGDEKSATWESKRKGDARVMTWTFSVEHAKTAKLGGSHKAENKGGFSPDSNWAKYPAQMCSWRAALFLAREEWTEITAGIYDPDEIREQRDAPADEAA